jgi:hypothetical protein
MSPPNAHSTLKMEALSIKCDPIFTSFKNYQDIVMVEPSAGKSLILAHEICKN